MQTSPLRCHWGWIGKWVYMGPIPFPIITSSPLFLTDPLAPQDQVTRWSSLKTTGVWNLHVPNGIQDPCTPSLAVNNIYSRCEWTSSAVVIFLFFKPDVITVPFAIYLMEIEKHGRSQFVRNFKQSIMSQTKNQHCHFTWPLAVLYRWKLTIHAVICSDSRGLH